jgi:hypothetical protein
MRKGIVAGAVAAALVAGIFFFVIPVSAVPDQLQGIRKASLPECKQENSGMRIGDMYCHYKYLGMGNGYWEWQPIPEQPESRLIGSSVQQNSDGTQTRCDRYQHQNGSITLENCFTFTSK